MSTPGGRGREGGGLSRPVPGIWAGPPPPVRQHVSVSSGDCAQGEDASNSMHSQKEIKADHEPECPVLRAFLQKSAAKREQYIGCTSWGHLTRSKHTQVDKWRLKHRSLPAEIDFGVSWTDINITEQW